MATNLEPAQLVEEAFMRRIHYKIQIQGPQPDQYAEIFSRCCAERGIEYDPQAVNHIYRHWYERRGIHARACHPRDILDHLVDISRFYEGKAVLEADMVDRACRSYFLDDSREE
jgi:hypothetical protein